MLKRSDIEERLQGAVEIVRQRIEKSPVPAFLVGILLGVVVSRFSDLLVPLCLVVAVVVAVLWFISDKDDAAGTPPSGPSGEQR